MSPLAALVLLPGHGAEQEGGGGRDRLDAGWPELLGPQTLRLLRAGSRGAALLSPGRPSAAPLPAPAPAAAVKREPRRGPTAEPKLGAALGAGERSEREDQEGGRYKCDFGQCCC